MAMGEGGLKSIKVKVILVQLDEEITLDPGWKIHSVHMVESPTGSPILSQVNKYLVIYKDI